LVKRGNVPWDVGRNAGQEFRQPGQLLVRVIETGNEQGDDLNPKSHPMQTANRIEDRLQASAQGPIVAIIEALEIDFVEIKPGAEVFEHLGSSIPIRNKPGDQAGGPGFLHDGDRPLSGDERLVVGTHQNAGALANRVTHQVLWRNIEWWRNRVGVAKRL